MAERTPNGSSLGTMLLERRSRPHRGVRVIRRQAAPFAAQVVPTRLLQPTDVQRTLRRLGDVEGPIVTSALTPSEQVPFVECGFTERESLHLLRHDFASRPGRPTVQARVRPARRTDQRRILEIDRLSFDEFWRFDQTSLRSARRATPHHRYVAAVLERTVVAYAIIGLAGATGYLQRLAVHPSARGRGVGSLLVLEAITWTINRGGLAMLVNTQTSNTAAVALYRSLGFELDREQLRVLEWRRP